MKYKLSASASFLIFICIFCNPFSSAAQSLLKEGYIIKTKGDTLKGFIHDLEWKKNPIHIDFQSTLASQVKRFEFDEMDAFYSSRGVLYVKRTVTYDAYDPANRKYPKSREPEVLNTQTVFAELIVRGDFSLYKMVQENGRIHFFIGRGQELEELLDRYYLSGDGLSLVHYEKWKQQLINYGIGCNSVSGNAENAAYRESDIKKIVILLNHCAGSIAETISSQLEGRKPKIGIFFTPFLHKTYGIVRGTAFASSLFSSLNTGAGISLEQFSRKNPNRLSTYSELKYRKVDQPVKDYHAPMSFDNIKLTSAMRFNYPPQNFFWNVGLGLGYRFNTITVPSLNKDSGFEMGAIVGAGKKIKLKDKLTACLEVRYEMDVIQFSGAQTLLPQSLGLVLGVQF